MLPIVTAACGGDSGSDLFGGNTPKSDAGNTGATGGASGTSGSAGSGAEPNGGTSGSGDASAGSSGRGAGGTSGMGAAGGAAGTVGASASGGTAGTSGGTNGSAGTGARDGGLGTGGSTGSAGTNGASGSAGTGGTNGGAGGDGGPDAGGGTAGADAGTDGGPDGGPKTCTNNNQCKNDEFCSKESCAFLTGECKPRPKTCSSNETPVCGCDGVNYWNDCLRQLVGAASSVSGECLTPATCGGLVSRDCPVGRALCAHLLASNLQCGVADAFGTCWVIPEQCPQIVVGASHRACSGSTDRCISKCEAIKTEHDYFTDSTCPQ